jgi:predicted AAA+ superfamily ATPase
VNLVQRLLEPIAREYLDAFRVVILNGPRQAGKTTLMRVIARRDGQIRSLDDPTELAAAINDPVGFISTAARPLFIDEVQRAGEPLIHAVKAEVDRDPRPGQFVLAGSTRFLAEPTLAESLAGRAGFLEVLPLSEGELSGQRTSFVDLAFDASADTWRDLPPANLERRDYVRLFARGGFPEPALMAGERTRRAWFASYVRAVTERDIREMARTNTPSAASTVLKAVAALSAQLLVVNTISVKADLARATVERYVALLEAVYLVDRLPPWSRNPLTRAVRHSKAYVVDSGLHCHLLGTNANALLNATSPHLGAVTETFVVNELRKQAGWSEHNPALYHYRDQRGRDEVDIILEAPDGRIVALEVKAAQSVNDRDLSRLIRLRDRLGSEFVHGLVVYLGGQRLSLGDRLTALPLAALWLTE